MFEHVVVGVEFSAGGEALLRSLPGLKRLGVRRLTLVTVAEAPNPLNGDAEYREGLRDRLEAERSRLRRDGFEVDAQVAVGEVDQTLREVATSTSASMIAVGSRSHSRVTDVFLGSTAWSVVREATIPVLLQRVEPEDTTAEMSPLRATASVDRVVYSTDWSATADRAFQYVESLALFGEIPTFILLHVRSQLEETHSGESTEDADLLRLDQLAGRLRRAGATDIMVEAPSGAPFVEIVRRADSHPGSLIVLGTRGRGLLGDAFLGSVSREVVRRTRSPVLLIPPG